MCLTAYFLQCGDRVLGRGCEAILVLLSFCCCALLHVTGVRVEVRVRGELAFFLPMGCLVLVSVGGCVLVVCSCGC